MLQTDWLCQHSGRAHKNPVTVTRRSFPHLNVWPVRLPITVDTQIVRHMLASFSANYELSSGMLLVELCNDDASNFTGSANIMIQTSVDGTMFGS